MFAFQWGPSWWALVAPGAGSAAEAGGKGAGAGRSAGDGPGTVPGEPSACSPREVEGLAVGVRGGSDPVWGGAGRVLDQGEQHLVWLFKKQLTYGIFQTPRNRTHHLASPVTKPQGPCPRGYRHRCHHPDVLDSRPRVVGAKSGSGDTPKMPAPRLLHQGSAAVQSSGRAQAPHCHSK